MIMLSSRNSIKTGAILSYLAIIINIGLGLIYTPWMIRHIGQSDYGLYTLANSLITLFMVDFGLSAATSRYVAAYRTENDTMGLKRFLGAVYRLYLIIDTLIFIILLAVFFHLEAIYGNLSPAEIDKLRVVFCIAGIYSIINFPCVTFNGILTAYEAFVPLKVADLAYRIGSVCLTVILLLLGGGLFSIVAINAACGLVVNGIKYYYVRKNIGFPVRPARMKDTDRNLYKDIFSFSLWATLTSFANRLVFNISPSILGMVCAGASSAIAVFGIISTIEGYAYTITTALNGMFMSKITRITHHTETSRTELTKLTTNVGRFQYIVNGLIVVGLAMIGKEFISLWMGDYYIDAYYGILLVIAPGLFYNSLQIANTALVVNKKVKYQAYVAIVTGVCNVILSLFLSRHWGVIGAAVAICLAYTLRNILNLVVIRAKLDIDLKHFIKHCYLKLSIPLVITLAIGYCVLHFIPSGGWLLLGVKGLIVITIYAIAIVCFGLSSQERKALLRRKKTSDI